MLQGWRVLESAARTAATQFDAALRDPVAAQTALLERIVAANLDCEFGRAHGFAAIDSLAAFRQSVPIAGYAAFAPAIEPDRERGCRRADVRAGRCIRGDRRHDIWSQARSLYGRQPRSLFAGGSSLALRPRRPASGDKGRASLRLDQPRLASSSIDPWRHSHRPGIGRGVSRPRSRRRVRLDAGCRAGHRRVGDVRRLAYGDVVATDRGRRPGVRIDLEPDVPARADRCDTGECRGDRGAAASPTRAFGLKQVSVCRRSQPSGSGLGSRAFRPGLTQAPAFMPRGSVTCSRRRQLRGKVCWRQSAP